MLHLSGSKSEPMDKTLDYRPCGAGLFAAGLVLSIGDNKRLELMN
jgi:hypothetical protein